MDCRAAAHALTQVATLLELHAGDAFTIKALQSAARTVAALGDTKLVDALPRELAEPELIAAPALALLRELAETHSSAQLEQLQEETPEGLLEMLRIPGLGPARIRAIHDGLDIDTVLELEQAARDGRLAAP